MSVCPSVESLNYNTNQLTGSSSLSSVLRPGLGSGLAKLCTKCTLLLSAVMILSRKIDSELLRLFSDHYCQACVYSHLSLSLSGCFETIEFLTVNSCLSRPLGEG